MTPAKVRALARRVAAVVPAGESETERVVMYVPDNGRGPPPARYPVGPGAAVVVCRTAADRPAPAAIAR